MSSFELFQGIKADIRKQHVQQLKALPLPPDPETTPSSLKKSAGLTPQQLEDWSKAGKAKIDAAINAKVVGGKTIDWNLSFFTFMESACTALRDMKSVHKAIKAAHDGQDAEAIEHLDSADEPIQKIVSLWGPNMHYVTLCDLIGHGPLFRPLLDGPYCGAFFSLDPATPFVGIAFKGTDFSDVQELITDLDFKPVTPTDGRLWGKDVSEGVYYTMFDVYTQISLKNPFDYILKVLHNSVLGDFWSAPVDLHVTGHSLGASYATIFFAELLRLSATATLRLNLRDLHTTGSPRLALEPFVDQFVEALAGHNGSSWRVANKDDAIPTIPPSPIGKKKHTFIHIDTAWKISDEDAPYQMGTERGTDPPKPDISSFFSGLQNHAWDKYHDALVYAGAH